MQQSKNAKVCSEIQVLKQMNVTQMPFKRGKQEVVYITAFS